MNIITWAEAVMLSAVSSIGAIMLSLEQGGSIEYNGLYWVCWSFNRENSFFIDNIVMEQLVELNLIRIN